MPYLDYDPDLLHPRQFAPPPAPCPTATRAALTTEKKMLEREAAPILDRLNQVRAELAALKNAA